MSAGIVGHRARPHRRRKGKASAVVTRPTPISVVSAVAQGPTLTVTFDQSVILRGIPRWPVGTPAALPTAATMPTPASVTLTYPVFVESQPAPAVPFEDAAIRNSRGGFVVSRLPAVTQASAAAKTDQEPMTMARAA